MWALLFNPCNTRSYLDLTEKETEAQREKQLAQVTGLVRILE